jgi:hypothetical protein
MVFEAHPIPRVGPQDDRVAHLRLLEFEPLGQHDARAVLFAGHRVFDGPGLDLPHFRNAHCGMATLTIHLEMDRGDDGLEDVGTNRSAGRDGEAPRPTLFIETAEVR